MADILSQEEIDRLLDEVTDEDSQWYNEKHCLPQRQVTLYDFKRPNRVSKQELRAFRSIHDMFARKTADTLSKKVKTIVEIQLHSVDQMSYGEFLMSLPNPTSFNVFSMKPLIGNCVFEVNPSIGYSLIDKILGGNGNNEGNNKEFSEIENAIMSDFLELFLNNLEVEWNPIIRTKMKLESQEISPNVIQITNQNEIVIMVVMEIITGNASGMVNICYPVEVLKDIFPELRRRNSNGGINSLNKKEKKRNWLKGKLNDLDIPIEIIMGKTEISIDRFKSINIGDIIMFDKKESQLKYNTLDIDQKTYLTCEEVKSESIFKKIKVKEGEKNV